MKARPDVQVQLASQRAAERVVHDSWRDLVGTGVDVVRPAIRRAEGPVPAERHLAAGVLVLAADLRRRASGAAVFRGRELQVDQAKLAVTAVELQARSEIRLAQESVKSYERALVTVQPAASQASDVLRITTSAFEVGATTNLEVIDAQRSARDADTLAVLQEDALRRAKLDLLVAIGRFPK